MRQASDNQEPVLRCINKYKKNLSVFLPYLERSEAMKCEKYNTSLISTTP